MAKVWKKFEKHFFEGENWKKPFKNHNPGQRIFPANNKKQNERYGLRIDAGEIVNGEKNVYLQVNSEATNTSLKKYISKCGTHSNVATAKIPVNVPVEKEEEVAKNLMADLWKQFTSKIR